PPIDIHYPDLMEHAKCIACRLPLIIYNRGQQIRANRRRLRPADLEQARVYVPLDRVAKHVRQQEQALFRPYRAIDVNLRPVQVPGQRVGNVARYHADAIEMLQVLLYPDTVFGEWCHPLCRSDCTTLSHACARCLPPRDLGPFAPHGMQSRRVYGYGARSCPAVFPALIAAAPLESAVAQGKGIFVGLQARSRGRRRRGSFTPFCNSLDAPFPLYCCSEPATTAEDARAGLPRSVKQPSGPCAPIQGQRRYTRSRCRAKTVDVSPPIWHPYPCSWSASFSCLPSRRAAS